MYLECWFAEILDCLNVPEKNLCIFLYCTHCGVAKVYACRFCSTVSRRADKIEIDMLFDVMLQAPTIWRFCLTFIYCSSQLENET